MENSPSTFEIIKDIILMIFAAIGSFVALSGLKAWRIQLKGKSEYELSTRILKSIYSLREAISRVRNPLITPGEMYSAQKEKGEPIKEKELDNWNIALVYEVRWNEISKAMNELKIVDIESEVLWGKSIPESLDKLYKIVVKLYITLQQFLNLNKKEFYSERDFDLRTKYEEIVYDRGSKDEPDPFSQNINLAIKEIEDLVRKYLK